MTKSRGATTTAASASASRLLPLQLLLLLVPIVRCGAFSPPPSSVGGGGFRSRTTTTTTTTATVAAAAAENRRRVRPDGAVLRLGPALNAVVAEGTASGASSSRPLSPFASLFGGLFGGEGKGSKDRKAAGATEKTAPEKFVEAWNDRNAEAASDLFADEFEYVDTARYVPLTSKSSLRRRLYLEIDSLPPGRTIVIDDVATSSDGRKVCVLRHSEDDDDGGGVAVPTSRSCWFFNVDGEGRITYAMAVPEPNDPKPGDVGLNVLNGAGKIIDATGFGYADDCSSSASAPPTTDADGRTAVERYFDDWNRRDMTSAVGRFDPNCDYDDTQYPRPFVGRDALESHLNRVSDCLPRSFVFVTDDVAVSNDGRKVGVRWHLENGDKDDDDEEGRALPFTRGCSFYALNEEGLIRSGLDFPEPAVVKPGAVRLLVDSTAKKVREEPIRVVPLALWIAYIYVVFLSDGILPGANALALEQRTWEEVRDLSVNFFLVSPLLHLPFAPTVHPMLEGIFNLLLSWAAMFGGFLSDDREGKPNVFPMLPAVVGMQFLTSAFYLPYLGLRTSERKRVGGDEGEAPAVYKEDLGTVEGTLGEFRGLGALLGGVGTASIAWSFLGRPEFGPFHERYASLVDLLSIDRVGSSFVVDLIIFGLFQGWLVDDDLRRRGVDLEGGEMALLRGLGKFVPFFGLAAYLTFRPELPSRSEASASVEE